MAGLRWVQLSGDERDELLGTGGTGVISFVIGADEPPASFPVSYGYDADSSTFYFRLSFPPGSRKETVIENPVSFVTYEETPRGWQSVVATGHLEEVADFPYDSAVVQAMWAIDIPTVDVFDRPRAEIDFYDFCLEPSSLTGRKEVE